MNWYRDPTYDAVLALERQRERARKQSIDCWSRRTPIFYGDAEFCAKKEFMRNKPKCDFCNLKGSK